MAVAQADPQTADEKVGRATRSKVNAEALDPNELTSVMFNLPAGLRVLVKADAVEQGVSLAAQMRVITAQHYGYELPVTLRQSTARRKYATPEEALAAKKAKADEQRRIMRAVMEAFNRGDPDAIRILEQAGI
jgi:hypothetical protein